MGLIHWIPGTHSLDSDFSANDGLRSARSTEMLLFYNSKRYTLSHYILGHVHGRHAHSKARPYILAIFNNITPPLCFINIHQGHGDGSNIKKSYDQILRDINSDDLSIKDGNHRHVKSHKSQVILDILSKCRVILAGDLNRNQDDFELNLGTKFKMNNSKIRKPTEGFSHKPVVRDHIFSSNNVGEITAEYPVPIKPASDHLPVYSVVNPQPNNV